MQSSLEEALGIDIAETSPTPQRAIDVTAFRHEIDIAWTSGKRGQIYFLTGKR